MIASKKASSAQAIPFYTSRFTGLIRVNSGYRLFESKKVSKYTKKIGYCQQNFEQNPPAI